MLYRTLATIVAVSLALVVQVEARPRHKHVSTATYIDCQIQRGCFEVTKFPKQKTSTQSYSAKRHPPVDSNGNTTALIQRARGYLGMTAGQIGLKRRSLWCAAFLRYLGVALPDDRAISGLKLPRSSGSVGDIAVFPHHIGIVTGFGERGYPIIISGNSTGRRVAEGLYPRRPIAYVSPI